MNNFKKSLIHPPRLLALSFLAAIVVGSLLLLIPAATASGKIKIIDAFFTATSAICVTGLIVVDTNTYFSSLGHTIIIILIQLGGLGIMTFSSFILLTAGRRVSLTGKLVVEGSLRPSAISSFRELLRDVFIFTFSIESLGAILLLIRFGQKWSFPRAMALSVFHSISAFCNAGFSLFSENLANYRGDVLVNLVMMLLIVLGGLGFFVLQEIKLAIKHSLSGERVKFSLHTKLVASVTTGIILAGSILIFLADFRIGLAGLPVKEKILVPLFHAVSARTAGFNTIDLNQLSVASALILILVMFVGASPGSTGGGVKTTTFGVIFAFIRSRIKGYEVPQIFSRAIRHEDIIKAYTLISLAMGLIFAATFSLLIIQPELSFKAALFEVVSAFGTVGLSLGITPQLHPLGKLVLIAVMYVGRIGPLTMLYAFSRVRPLGAYQYVEENIMVG